MKLFIVILLLIVNMSFHLTGSSLTKVHSLRGRAVKHAARCVPQVRVADAFTHGRASDLIARSMVSEHR